MDMTFQNLALCLLSGKQGMKHTYYATLRCITTFCPDMST